MIKVILELRYASSFKPLNKPLKFGQKLLAMMCFLVLYFFHSAECHMVIVKHETHHLHDFMIKCIIFHVNQVNFDQKHCTLALIQREWCRKNRLGAETIVALPLLLCSCDVLQLHFCVRCECSNLLTWLAKKNMHCLHCLRVWCETGLKLWGKTI